MKPVTPRISKSIGIPADLSTDPRYTKGESARRNAVAAGYGYVRVHQVPKRCFGIDSILK
jgi:hypothetical protein